MIDSGNKDWICVIELATRPGQFSQQIQERMEQFRAHQPQGVAFAEAERLAEGINDIARRVLDEQGGADHG